MSASTTTSAPSPQGDLFPTSVFCPTLSRAARRVRTSAAPTPGAKASTARGRVSTSKPSGWSENAALAGSLLRTALTSELAARTGCSMRWRRSATPLKRAWWALEMSVPAMSANGPGSLATIPRNLPTPVSQSQQGGMRMEGGSGARAVMKASGLYDVFRTDRMATPRASDAGKGGRGDVLAQMTGQENRHAGMPTPRASDMAAGGHGAPGRMGTVRHCLRAAALEILPTPTKRDSRMDGWSDAYDRRKSPTMDAVMDGAMTGRAPPDRWAGARALAMLLRSHGLTGTAALPLTYGWMMGFPPGWLARALHSAMDVGRLLPASSSRRSVTRSSRTSLKP